MIYKSCAPLLVTLVLIVGGCGENFRGGQPAQLSEPFVVAEHTFSGETFRQWRLPPQLREISGLALTEDQRLFAHGDEEAVLFELDYEHGAIIKSFSLGNPPARGDFEGIAYVEDRFYLVTSGGRVYVAPEGANGTHVEYRSFETGIGEVCEVEGLAYDPNDRNLLFACKLSLGEVGQNYIKIQRFPVDLEGGSMLSPINVGLSQVLEKTGGGHFNPSGIELVGSDRLVLVAARQSSVLEINFAGKVIGAFKLPLASFHPQTEGITFDAAGQLILADEGGMKRGRLGIYRPAG